MIIYHVCLINDSISLNMYMWNVCYKNSNKVLFFIDYYQLYYFIGNRNQPGITKLNFMFYIDCYHSIYFIGNRNQPETTKTQKLYFCVSIKKYMNTITSRCS